MIIAMTRPIFFKKSKYFARSCQIVLWIRVGVFGVMLVLGGSVFANDLFARGEEAFLYSRPQEAASLMEQVIAQDPVNARAYLYLAMSYEQLNMYERAITTLKRSESIPGIDIGLVKFNIGNNYLHLGDTSLAELAYDASIQADPVNADSYLNRANVRVMTEAYEVAIEDYIAVLGIEPDHEQRPQIERMIALLQGHIESERTRLEMERLRAEEEARLLQEEQERKLREAEERRRALLSNVLDAIQTATDDTENMSAGSEEIDDYDDEEFDIAD